MAFVSVTVAAAAKPAARGTDGRRGGDWLRHEGAWPGWCGWRGCAKSAMGPELFSIEVDLRDVAVQNVRRCPTHWEWLGGLVGRDRMLGPWARIRVELSELASSDQNLAGVTGGT